MAQGKRRPQGSGSLTLRGRSWVMRWRERRIDGSGRVGQVLRQESLGPISKRKAEQRLRERLREADSRIECDATVVELVETWDRTILPMYKHSTQRGHRQILKKHLLPRFGSIPLGQVERKDIQAFLTEKSREGYAPHTVHHYRNVLSGIFRYAVEWDYLEHNPASGIRLPKLTPKRERWALSRAEAARLIQALDHMPRTLVALALVTGLRRGEILALQWKDFDAEARILNVRQGLYENQIDTPKTERSTRSIPLSEDTCALLSSWASQVRYSADPDAFMFSTRKGSRPPQATFSSATSIPPVIGWASVGPAGTHTDGRFQPGRTTPASPPR